MQWPLLLAAAALVVRLVEAAVVNSHLQRAQQSPPPPPPATGLTLSSSDNETFNWLSLAAWTMSDHFAMLQMHGERHHYGTLCDRLRGLNPVQRDMCRRLPLAMPYVGQGARDAIYQCQLQFKNERWNCSDRHEVTTSGDREAFQDLLGQTMRAANRETAYLAAVTSAGLTYSITKACSTGNLSDCSCDMQPAKQKFVDYVVCLSILKLKPQQDPNAVNSPIEPTGTMYSLHNNHKQFSWGGCSDNVVYGVKFAKRFLDEFEKLEFDKDRDVRRLSLVHNHLVGREAISQNLRKHCRCHGVSGSCEFKTCWLQMPKMNEVAEILKKRYALFAVQVTKKARKRLRRKDRTQRSVPIRGNELTYVFRSPSYCDRNDTLGILGTSGRECNRQGLEVDSCENLCCGRGHNTRLVTQVSQCHCKFVWCCTVKCKECREDVNVHTCK